MHDADREATRSTTPVPSTPATPATTDAEALGFAAVRDLITACRDAVAGLRHVSWQAGGSDLAGILGDLGELALAVDAAEIAVLADAITRGEPGSGPVPLAPADWLSAHSRRYPTATAAARPIRLATQITHQAIPESLTDAVLTGAAPVPAATVAIREMRRLTPDLQDEFIPFAWERYTDLARLGDPTLVRQLRPRIIAEHGDPDRTDNDHQKARDRACLSRGTPDPGGALTDYRMSLDPESAALLEAALDPLTAPHPGPDGEPDTRPWTTRRAHALIDLIHRATTTDTTVPGRGSTHTTLLVRLRDLSDHTGHAATIGGLDTGRLLSIGTARALSCTGQITPVVLDDHGNPILIGRTKRFFTPTQIHALLIRDGATCTFPGCTRPAGWTDAHHLIHWTVTPRSSPLLRRSDTSRGPRHKHGGTTDLDNAALLCRHHHTTVHTRHLAATLTTGPPGSSDEHRHHITWNLTPGSYHDLLAAHHARAPGAA